MSFAIAATATSPPAFFRRDGYNVKISGMRVNKTWIAAVILVALPGLSGCSVISFFPSKAAEKAADKVLDDFLPGSPERDAAAKPPEPKRP